MTSTSTAKLSLLEIVQQCNSVPSTDTLIASGDYYRFLFEDSLIGIVSSSDITALEKACAQQDTSKHATVFEFIHSEKTLRFSAALTSSESRSKAVAELLDGMRGSSSWASLAKWRNELYPIYAPTSDGTRLVAMIERASSYNFGIRTYGVHLNGIVRGPDGVVRMWVGKRAATKQTWPGYLDQIVAGGIGNGMGVRESVIKECYEEGGIPESIARGARAAGTIQYFTRSSLGLQPETEYVFDLELPLDFTPTPTDGEVEEFYLWSIDEVIDNVRKNLFKPNCAICVIDFLIRHGYLTPENESDYIEIIENIHCALPFPGPK
ncbi:hypothetical protein LPJ73_003968 [Coemansia sp. RSA 2703]|nr:hypothetical protein LPJ73_003968 [Coemansia sp. RSA 2703]KAJ2360935.1 hypothetical protein IW150_007367 [Coemansia sp. RSA 2607]